MNIRLRSTGAVLTEGEFRARHAGTSFPAHLTEALINDFGGDVVFEGPQATGGDRYQFSVYSGVEQINGKWYTKYALGPTFVDTEDKDGKVTTAAEHEAAYKAAKDAEQAKRVRDDRTKRLSECDWTQLPDAPVDTQAWANYRKALRDISIQPGFPWEIEWPTKP